MSHVSQQSRIHPATRGTGALIGPAALVLLGLVALPLLWHVTDRLAALLGYPYPNDSLEATMLYEARLLWAGEPLYQPLELHRFVSAPYPPLHPLLLGLADRLAGPHVFWGGRLLSLAAALGVAALVALLVRRVAGSWLAGLLGAALLLSTPPALLWATRIKPDMLALFWTALGLYLATTDDRPTTNDQRPTDDDKQTRRQGDKQIRRQGGGESETQNSTLKTQNFSSILHPPSSILKTVAAAVCFVLAFLCKQTALAAPLASGLALLVADVRAFRGGARDGYLGRLPLRRRTLTFALSYLALLASVWLILDAVTHGQFSFHIWVMHRWASWSPHLLAKFVALLAPYWPSMLLGVVVLARAAVDARALVPAWYLVLAPISLLGAGKTGANHNHLLETLLALALAAGIAIGWASRAGRGRLPAAALVIGLFAVQLGLAYRPQEWYTGELAPDDPPERFMIFIRSTPGEILADDVGLLFMAGRPLRYDDPSGMGPVALSGLWDQRGLVEEINQRRFSAIMLPIDIKRATSDPAGRWTPEMLAAIRSHYRLAFHDKINTYVPK